jgi:hypothetical protein
VYVCDLIHFKITAYNHELKVFYVYIFRGKWNLFLMRSDNNGWFPVLPVDSTWILGTAFFFLNRVPEAFFSCKYSLLKCFSHNRWEYGLKLASVRLQKLSHFNRKQSGEGNLRTITVYSTSVKNSKLDKKYYTRTMTRTYLLTCTAWTHFPPSRHRAHSSAYFFHFNTKLFEFRTFINFLKIINEQQGKNTWKTPRTVEIAPKTTSLKNKPW